MEAMREQTQVSIIHRETVKPSSPTPSQIFNLSFLDQTLPPIYTPFLLIYGNNNDQDEEATNSQEKRAKRSQHLRKSLSETLTRYYLFAGRITNIDGLPVINCNDEGVPYLEAQANCSVSSLLEHPTSKELNLFTPTNKRNDSSLILLVQVTFLSCGGVAIGMLFSHKIADGPSTATFAKAWASASLGHPDSVVPDFTTSGSLFPPMNPFPIKLPPSSQLQQNLEAYAARRFVFEASKVAALRDRATRTGQPRPTRVEAVSALFWKCTVAAAASRSRSGTTQQKPSILTWTVNLRDKVVPPILGSAMGNIFVVMKVQSDERAKALPDWVNQLRTGMKEFREKCLEKLRGSGSVPVILDLYTRYMKDRVTSGGSVNHYAHTSCCGMSVYETDFGWGKPAWVRIIDISSYPNAMTMLDTSDGKGIEAWVNLMKEDMALLECDPELLEFAAINPSPLQQARNKVYHSSAL